LKPENVFLAATSNASKKRQSSLQMLESGIAVRLLKVLHENNLQMLLFQAWLEAFGNMPHCR